MELTNWCLNSCDVFKQIYIYVQYFQKYSAFNIQCVVHKLCLCTERIVVGTVYSSCHQK